jgi:hypothetical protein
MSAIDKADLARCLPTCPLMARSGGLQCNGSDRRFRAKRTCTTVWLRSPRTRMTQLRHGPDQIPHQPAILRYFLGAEIFAKDGRST